MLKFIDSHCHLQDPEFFTSKQAEIAYHVAVKAGVETMLCIGTSASDSTQAVEFAKNHQPHCFASIGIHPHEASKFDFAQIKTELQKLEKLAGDSVVKAVGECGLDFYYNDKSEVYERQKQLLAGQLTLAKKHNLPLSFHVREAFDDFWPIFDSFSHVKGVLHSFTDRPAHLEKALERGLLIGINGIATFTTHSWQRDLFKTVQLDSIILETDAPFLTPVPKRGTINTPETVIYITKFLAELRGESEETIAKATTANAQRLFSFN